MIFFLSGFTLLLLVACCIPAKKFFNAFFTQIAQEHSVFVIYAHFSEAKFWPSPYPEVVSSLLSVL